MTLNAEIRHRGEGKQISVSYSMGPMTAQTIYPKILISGIDYFFSHGMAGMLQPVVAGSTEFNH